MGVADIVLRIPGMRGVVGRLSRWYRAEVEKELRAHGLRYDDLLIETDPEVAKAISQLPPLEQELRNKRLKRALDLDMKKTSLPDDIAKDVDVWNPYLSKRMEVLKRQRLEKQLHER